MADILGTLGKLLGKAEQAADFQGPDLLTTLLGARSIQEKVGRLASGFEEGFAGAKPKPSPLNPMQENVLKQVFKQHAKQIEEAMAMGASGEQVLKDAGIRFEKTTQQPTTEGGEVKEVVEPTGVIPHEMEEPIQQQAGLPQLLQPQGLFTTQALTPEGNIQLGGKLAMGGRSLEQLQTLQELLGKQPLQAGEKEKLEIESFNNLLTTGNKAVSGDTAKLLGNVGSGLEQLDLMEEAFTRDPDIFGKPAVGNALSQTVRVMTQDLTDIIGRLRSGGAINAEEQKNFLAQLPKRGFIAGKLEKPETVKFKLNKLRRLFQDIKAKAQPVQGNISQGVQAALQAGFSRKDIIARLKKKGLL